VLSRGDRRPLAGLEVELAWWSPERGSPGARGTTDSSGAVRLSLEPESTPHEALCTVEVGRGERSRRFGAIPLREEIVVLMDECTRLHGQLVISGLEAGARAWVQANEPRSGTMSCPVMLCRAQADADGRFELQACPAREVPWVDVEVSVASLSVTRRIRWEELAGEAGARIELAFGELLVRVVDTEGNAIANAAVRIGALDDDATFPAVGKSDARGEFRATLESRVCEVIAAAAGFSSRTDEVDLQHDGPRSITLALRKLGDEDLLAGRVVNEDGAPVEGALVSASPAIDAREAAMAGIAQIRSGADGSFELAIETDRELNVVAFRRDLGMSDELRLLPRGRRLELVIRRQGSLEVRIEPPPGLAAFAGGLVEYALVDRRLVHFDYGHEFQVPFQLDELPVGDYQLFVHVGGWKAYAEGSVRIESTQPARIELASQPAHFSSGSVRSSVAGSVASGVLKLEHPTWPAEVEKLWASPLLDGRFECFLGAESSCAATLLRPLASPWPVQLHSGSAQELLVP